MRSFVPSQFHFHPANCCILLISRYRVQNATWHHTTQKKSEFLKSRQDLIYWYCRQTFYEKHEKSCRYVSCVSCTLWLTLRNQRVPGSGPATSCQPFAVIVRLMSKRLWSGWEWYKGVKGMVFSLRCCPVNCECSWKKTQVEKKSKRDHLKIT